MCICRNKKSIQQKEKCQENYDFKDVSEKFNEYFHDSSQEHKIFTELGFSWEEDQEFCAPCDRNGSCPIHDLNKNVYVDGRLNLSNTPKLKKINVVVDLLSIADSMENSSDEFENQSYLDIETGEVEFLSYEIINMIESGVTDFSDLPEWQIDEVDLGKKVLADESRFISIPKLESHEGFKFMEEFIEEVKSPKVSDELSSSLTKNRPFRRFKDCLSQYSDIEQQWYAFKNEKLKGIVKGFISSIHHDRIELILPKGL